MFPKAWKRVRVVRFLKTSDVPLGEYLHQNWIFAASITDVEGKCVGCSEHYNGGIRNACIVHCIWYYTVLHNHCNARTWHVKRKAENLNLHSGMKRSLKLCPFWSSDAWADLIWGVGLGLTLFCKYFSRFMAGDYLKYVWYWKRCHHIFIIS